MIPISEADMLQWIQALSPLFSALIGVVSYATLTNYRLDLLDKQVSEISTLRADVNQLDKRVSILENNSHE